MNALDYKNIRFLKSAAESSDLPPDIGAEVAFAGRSNSGKSSALNAITGHTKLARTSKTPGRTQLINFFELTTEHRLVDLPGYGYAKVPQALQARWERALNHYIIERRSLRGIVLLMDIRHPLKPFDWHMIEWARLYHHPIHILLTKTDKLNRTAAERTLRAVRQALVAFDEVSSQLFSAQRKQGIETAHQKLDAWLTGKSVNMP